MTTTYCGIADAHGIESFVEKDPKGNQHALMSIRAVTNRQRHAVYYELELEPGFVSEITEELKESGPIEALNTMKVIVDEHDIEVRLGGGGDVVASYNLIPNPDLDPWG